VLFIYTIASGKLKIFLSYTKYQILISFFLGLLGTCVYYLLLYYAYAHAKGLEVLVIQYTWPTFVTIFSILILKEKVTLRTTAATLIGFIGIVIAISKGNITQISLGNLYLDLVVIIAACTFGLFSVLSKKCNYESITFTTYLYISGTLFSFIAMYIFSKAVFPQSNSLHLIVLNGALINGLSYVFWILALKYRNASFVAPFVFLTPVIAAFLIVFFFSEPLIPAYFISLAMVVIAGLLSK
jgi:drug/metabolite transporter (DMT)-like permease